MCKKKLLRTWRRHIWDFDIYGILTSLRSSEWHAFCTLFSFCICHAEECLKNMTWASITYVDEILTSLRSSEWHAIGTFYAMRHIVDIICDSHVATLLRMTCCSDEILTQFLQIAQNDSTVWLRFSRLFQSLRMTVLI